MSNYQDLFDVQITLLCGDTSAPVAYKKRGIYWIILAWWDEMSTVVLTPAGVTEFHDFDRGYGALCLQR